MGVVFGNEVYGCSSCGGDHTGHGMVRFQSLARPVLIKGKEWKWSGECPKTKEVIYMRECDNKELGD